MTPTYNVGDVVFTSGATWLSRAIRWATRDAAWSEVSHAGMVISNDRDLEHSQIVEAVHKIRNVQVQEVYGPTDELEVWRSKNVPRHHLRMIAEMACARVGRRYPYAKLLLHLADEVLSRSTGKDRYVMRRLDVTKTFVCSGEVALWYGSQGYNFGKPHQALTPDDMRDFMVANPDKWECVRTLGPL